MPAETLYPSGAGDEAQLAASLASQPQGGRLELGPGTWLFDAPLDVREDDTTIEGHGDATIIKPSAKFPEGQPLIRVYRDDIRPVAHAKLRHFAISGAGVTRVVHGIDFCAYRSSIVDVSIYGLRGDGLITRGAAGADGAGWGNYETKLAQVDIGGCRTGMVANSGDQHWTDCVIHTNVECNLRGNLAGCMIENCHFFSGAQNWAKKQTVRNVHLSTSSRTVFMGGKIEHAAQELLWLDGNPQGGFVRFVGVGFRGGSSQGAGLYPQAKINGPGKWRLIFVGCSFDADRSDPSWAIELADNSVTKFICTGTLLNPGTLGTLTPNIVRSES